MNRPLLRAVCLAGVCALLLPGCGGDDDPAPPAHVAAAADTDSLDWNAAKTLAVQANAGALAKRWSSNLNAHARYEIFYSLRADGLSAISSSSMGQPENERFYNRYWVLQADGRLYMARASNAQGQSCNPGVAAPNCKAQGTERYWRFVAQQGKTLFVIEQGPFIGVQNEPDSSYRFVALTDVGEPK